MTKTLDQQEADILFPLLKMEYKYRGELTGFVMNTQLGILSVGIAQANNNHTSRFCWCEQTVKISIC